MVTLLTEYTLAAALMVRFGAAADAFLGLFSLTHSLSSEVSLSARPLVRPTLNLLRISPTR